MAGALPSPSAGWSPPLATAPGSVPSPQGEWAGFRSLLLPTPSACIMETASRNCPLSCPAHRGAETGSVVRPASPLGAPWAGRPVPRSCDVPVAPCGCQAPSEKAPPGQLSTDANQRLAAPGAAATHSAGSAPGSEGRGGGRRLRLGLASETISCSLEGSQRGVWDALEVEESPAARGPWRGGHPVEPGCCPPVWPALCPARRAPRALGLSREAWGVHPARSGADRSGPLCGVRHGPVRLLPWGHLAAWA